MILLKLKSVEFLMYFAFKSWKVGFTIYTNLGFGFEIQIGPFIASAYKHPHNSQDIYYEDEFAEEYVPDGYDIDDNGNIIPASSRDALTIDKDGNSDFGSYDITTTGTITAEQITSTKEDSVDYGDEAVFFDRGDYFERINYHLEKPNEFSE